MTVDSESIIYLFSNMYLHGYLCKALQLSIEVARIVLMNWSKWDNLTVDQSFLSANFLNLKFICLHECDISSCELNRFFRVFSLNESIKFNQEKIEIFMFDIYDKNLLHNLLQAKPYGFAKLSI